MLLIGAFVLLVNPATHAQTTDQAPVQGSSSALEGVTWLLKSIDHIKQVNATVPLNFDASRVYGSDGCNRFSGEYASNGAGHLTFNTQRMVSTKMACIGAQDQIDAVFYKVLSATKSYVLRHNQLLLRDAAGNTLAVYQPSSTTLVGTQWQISGLNNGKQGVYSADNLAQVRVSFLPKTTLRAQVDCATIAGKFAIDTAKKQLKITQLKTDLKQCKSNEKPNVARSELMQALKNTSHYQRTGNQLELRSADGALQIGAHLTADLSEVGSVA